MLDPRAGGDKNAIADALEEARARTWLLVDGLPEGAFRTAIARYLSPPAWDVGHIANFEELWLVQTLQQRPELHPGDNATYNAFENPRHERPNLALLDREGARAYMERVRGASLESLAASDIGPDGPPLTRDGFVFWMLVLHEHQHQETLLQSFALHREAYKPAAARPLPEPRWHSEPWCHVPAGPFTMGRAQGPGVYDNEAPAHCVDVPAFDIARYPVTNQEWIRFVETGGYEQESWWSNRGTEWLQDEPHHAPLHWRRQQGIWHRYSPIDGWQRVADRHDEIVSHVTYWEAEAFASWRGARLPSEAEWEKAARWTPPGETDDGRAPQTLPIHPWGDAPAAPNLANIDQLGWQPSRIGAYPAGAAPCGAEHMIGDVWEWTSSGFDAYPEARAYPYPEYSEVFYGGDWKVLRGGAWATRAPCATATFRNWDHPYRRQIFSGVRLARDA